MDAYEKISEERAELVKEAKEAGITGLELLYRIEDRMPKVNTKKIKENEYVTRVTEKMVKDHSPIEKSILDNLPEPKN